MTEPPAHHAQGESVPAVSSWPPPVWPVTSAQPVPGTVSAAAIVTWVCCGLTFGLTVLSLAMAAFVGAVILPQFATRDALGIAAAVLASGGMSVLACASASWLAWLVWRRRAWARIALAVCSGLTAVASVMVLGPHTLLIAPGAIAVLVLLFLPASNAWFASRPGR